MTGVSYWEFAVHMHRAGAIPSISTYCYYRGTNQLDISKFEYAIKNFTKITGSNNLIVTVEEAYFLDIEFVDIIKKYGIKYLEIFPSILEQRQLPVDIDIIKETLHKDFNTKIFYRLSNIELLKQIIGRFDGVVITGNDSAGHGAKRDTKTIFLEMREFFRNKKITLIPGGGIGTPQQVQEYFELGADAVAVGTLFAACKESALSDAVKQKMIGATKQDLSRFSDTRQQSLMLGPEIKGDNNNHSISLQAGIKGDGSIGHVFAGHGIDSVTKIRTARETVEYLMGKNL